MKKIFNYLICFFSVIFFVSIYIDSKNNDEEYNLETISSNLSLKAEVEDEELMPLADCDGINHTLQFMPSTARCNRYGYPEHYKCIGCSKTFNGDGPDKIEIELALMLNPEKHESFIHYPYQEPTCQNLYGRHEFWKCNGCSKYFDSEGENRKEIEDGSWWFERDPNKNYHKLTHHAKVEPTCLENGKKEYWSCSECNNNYFDENATDKVFNLTQLDIYNFQGDYHVADVETEMVHATCTTEGKRATKHCSVCDKNLYCTDLNVWREYHFDNAYEMSLLVIKKHEETLIREKYPQSIGEPNCTELFYTTSLDECSVCGALVRFADKEEVTLEEVTTKKPHVKETSTWYPSDEYKPATCTENGSRGFIYCSYCRKSYLVGSEELLYDGYVKNNEEIYNEKVFLPKLGHDFSEYEFSWIDEGKGITYELHTVCKNDPSHFIEYKKEDGTQGTAHVMEGDSKEATCYNGGYSIYTAHPRYYEKNSSYTYDTGIIETKVIYTPKLLHHAEAGDFWWNEDYSVSIFGFTCTNCNDFIEVEARVEMYERDNCREHKKVYVATCETEDQYNIDTGRSFSSIKTIEYPIQYEHSFSEWRKVYEYGSLYLRECRWCYTIEQKSNEVDTHEHNYERVYPRDSTCLDEGFLECYWCYTCGKYFDLDKNEVSREDVYIPIKEHNFDVYQEYIPPTCDVNGRKENWHCSICDCYYDKYGNTLHAKYSSNPLEWDLSVPILFHDYANHAAVIDTSVATCEHAQINTDVLYCNRCHKYFSSNNHEEVTKFVAPKLDHNFDYSVEYKAPTCTENGNVFYKHCSICDKYYDNDNYWLADNVEALTLVGGHDYYYVWGLEPASYGCEKEGFDSHYKCRRCDKVFFYDKTWLDQYEYFGDHLTEGEVTMIPSHGHRFDETEFFGVEDGHCNRCEYCYKAHNFTAHNYGEEEVLEDGTVRQVCIDCKYAKVLSSGDGTTDGGSTGGGSTGSGTTGDSTTGGNTTGGSSDSEGSKDNTESNKKDDGAKDDSSIDFDGEKTLNLLWIAILEAIVIVVEIVVVFIGLKKRKEKNVKAKSIVPFLALTILPKGIIPVIIVLAIVIVILTAIIVILYRSLEDEDNK